MHFSVYDIFYFIIYLFYVLNNMFRWLLRQPLEWHYYKNTNVQILTVNAGYVIKMKKLLTT